MAHGNEIHHGPFPSYLEPVSPWIVPMDFPSQNLHRGILLPVSAPQVSNTALAARECLRVVARANPSQAVPVVLEAPMLVGTRCSGFFYGVFLW